MVLWYLKRLLFRTQGQYLPLSTSSPKSPRSPNEFLGGHCKSIDDEFTANNSSPYQDAWRSRIIDSRTISDATIGLADGLTVPFALTAGLSALGSPRVVVYGGLAELIAGAISMGLGGYLGGRCEADAHSSLVQSTLVLVRDHPSQTASLVRDVFSPYALPPSLIDSLNSHLTSLPPSLQTEFIMNFHHQSPTEQTDRAILSAVTIALGYFLGGAVPLLPYILVGTDGTMQNAFRWSCFVMVIALFTFGAVKTRLVLEESEQWEMKHVPLASQTMAPNYRKRNATKCVRGGIEMVVLGGVAAGAAMSLVKMVT